MYMLIISQMDLPLAQLCTCLLKTSSLRAFFQFPHITLHHYWCSTISSKHPGNLASEHFPPRKYIFTILLLFSVLFVFVCLFLFVCFCLLVFFPFVCLRTSWKTGHYRLKEYSYIIKKKKTKKKLLSLKIQLIYH